MKEGAKLVLSREVIDKGASRRWKLISATREPGADGILVTRDTFNTLGWIAHRDPWHGLGRLRQPYDRERFNGSTPVAASVCGDRIPPTGQAQRW